MTVERKNGMGEIKVYLIDDYAASEYYMMFVQGAKSKREAMLRLSEISNGAMLERFRDSISSEFLNYMQWSTEAKLLEEYYSGNDEAIEELRNSTVVRGIITEETGKYFQIPVDEKFMKYATDLMFMSNYESLTESLDDEEAESLIDKCLEMFMLDKVEMCINMELDGREYRKDAFKKCRHSVGKNQ